MNQEEIDEIRKTLDRIYIVESPDWADDTIRSLLGEIERLQNRKCETCRQWDDIMRRCDEIRKGVCYIDDAWQSVQLKTGLNFGCTEWEEGEE